MHYTNARANRSILYRCLCKDKCIITTSGGHSCDLAFTSENIELPLVSETPCLSLYMLNSSAGCLKLFSQTNASSATVCLVSAFGFTPAQLLRTGAYTVSLCRRLDERGVQAESGKKHMLLSMLPWVIMRKSWCSSRPFLRMMRTDLYKKLEAALMLNAPVFFLPTPFKDDRRHARFLLR